ncbi:TIGR03087 family PEP-CTERM/XrtA system glycosyltransferase [Sphingomonas sp.]|jgi:sugar transferase (PEP-CTERM/EpsH1 system associated)|uniref:TIGR03087 family PEP-CTERM/XrtA system glycosyltransferase n=1 Tax=Sphingomonas sp. TaxID=28214 RepID=UPI002E0D17A1|nr:TIGR03087 family PEP-CTERM/XrtA system glycosyltransferase [Sphingomonas sp.]
MGDILFLAHRVPFPPDRGDKIRAYHILRHLSARNRVHLLAFADDPADLMPGPGLSSLTGEQRVLWRGKRQAVAGVEALLTGRPVSVAAFGQRAARRAVKGMLSQHPIDTIYVFSSQMAQYVPADAPQRVIMDFVDVDSAKFAAYGAQGQGLHRWVMRREARLLAAHDQAVAARADASLFVSEEEAALFRTQSGAERVHAVGNGIDTGVFDPDAPFEHIAGNGMRIVFTGQMDYRPNVEGVIWFVEAILPQIRVRHPGLEVAIVGRKPTEAVIALARHDGVVVTGEVADVRPWLHAASVVVAPLKLARGVQNKVLEAMAMARPVVATSAAATGIDHGGTVELGDTAGGFAAAVNRILADPETAAEFGALARKRVIDHYSWGARLSALDAIVGLSHPVAPASPQMVAAA